MELISFQQYDDQWSDIFLTEQYLIVINLKQYVYKIHHTGSAAIRELLAKPIIDDTIESAFYPTYATYHR